MLGIVEVLAVPGMAAFAEMMPSRNVLWDQIAAVDCAGWNAYISETVFATITMSFDAIAGGPPNPIKPARGSQFGFPSTDTPKINPYELATYSSPLVPTEV